jgi:hypothetical protein
VIDGVKGPVVCSVFETETSFLLILPGLMLVFLLQVIDPTGILRTQLEVRDAVNY